MTDYRSVLERDLARVGPAPFGFDDVARRRDRRQRNRRIAAGAVALALIALVIGGWLGAITLDRSVPADDRKVPSGDLPTTPGDWTRVRFPGDQLSAIVAGGPGLVAVGSDGGHAAIWASTDGRMWDLALEESAHGFSDVTVGGPGLVAVGSGPDGGAVWTSVDGSSWSRVPADPIFEDAWLQAVVVGGPGLVAVGSDPDGLQAWYSPDGITWKPASVPSLPPDVELFEDQPIMWIDVAASGDRLVAVGYVDVGLGGNTYRQEPTIWTSDDGVSWVEADMSNFEDSWIDLGVAAGPNGFVGVGTYSLWYSRDGERWQRAPSKPDLDFREPANGFYLRMSSVGGGSGGYVASGYEWQCAAGPIEEGRFVDVSCRIAQSVIWTSGDGVTWARVPPDPRFEGDSDPIEASFVTTWGRRFVVATDALWISDLPVPAANP